MIFAAIDIGSNAVRLLFSNAFFQEEEIHIEKATLIRVPVRLGLDVYKNNKISKKRANNLIKTMQAFRLLIDVYKPQDYAACATAAIREAVNGEELIEKIKKQTDISVKVIDGLEEAAIIRAMGNHLFPSEKKFTMYVDLGGGSTEISLTSKGQLIAVNSFKIGTLRMLSGKVPDSEWNSLKNWLFQFKESFGLINVIGSGGNINKLAKVYGFDDAKTLSTDQLQFAINHLRGFEIEDRIKSLGLKPDRADVILPAAEVFQFITNITGAESIYAPRLGLADGLIYQLFETYLANKRKKG